VKVLPTADPTLSTAKVKPSEVEWLMAGDFMTKLHWRHWGRPRATARGTYYVNQCDPCAAGHYKKVRASVTVSKIATCRGVRLYTSGTARYLVRGHWRKAHGLGVPPNPCSG
jgi:hypothetical protein